MLSKATYLKVRSNYLPDFRVACAVGQCCVMRRARARSRKSDAAEALSEEIVCLISRCVVFALLFFAFSAVRI